MNSTRRVFLYGLSALAAAKQVRAAHQMKHSMPKLPNAPQLVDPNRLTPFVDALPIPPIAKPVGEAAVPGTHGASCPLYRLPMAELTARVHRDVPPVRFWGFGGSMPGQTIEVKSGHGVLVDWPNELPAHHFLPVDHQLMGAEADKPEVRAVVHMHGARARPESDGYPEDWYVPGRSVRYHYPNDQAAALLWYHDHAMGINRLNVYAGLLGLYIVRDELEASLNLPGGSFEIPMVLTDRFITQTGQLYYPRSQRPESPWVPEVFGNAVLINGTLLPYVDVQARKYRFRILNGSNGRFYSLALQNNQSMHLIGSDQGLLAAPVEQKTLTLAPAERVDVVIDFAEARGQQIVLQDGAVKLMQFRVSPEKTADSSSLPKTLRSIPRMSESAAVRTRELTLDEMDTMLDEPMVHLLNNTRWHQPITEKPTLNSTEIWALVNPTEDTHPIHLHMVKFQVLDRRPFDVDHFLLTRQVRYVYEALPPEPGEMGWKDTVRAVPSCVTRIIVHFEGYPGRFVWHCHILEHEDNEMMRPYEIVTA